MSPKENFNKAVFDMFGVGSNPEAKAAAKEAEADTFTAPIETAETAAPVAPPAVSPVPDPGPLVHREPSMPRYSAPAPAPLSASMPRATTYLAPGTYMEGHLKAKGDVEVAGDFKGDITASGYVTLRTSCVGNVTADQLTIVACNLTGDVHASSVVSIDAASIITGNVFAEEVICAGQVSGDLSVNGNCTFQKGSIIKGNIATGTMTMERGALVSGSLTMNPPPTSAAAPTLGSKSGVRSLVEPAGGL